MIKAILFDLDGTLIDTNELIIQSFEYTFRKLFNKEISRKELVKSFGEPLRDTMSKYNKDRADLMVTTFRSFNETNHDRIVKRFEGVEDGIKTLKNSGIKLAVVTSKREKMAKHGLELIGIYDYMDVIVTPESTKKHKPDGEPALKACELLKISPQEAIMVGDSHNDILCGKNAGCYTCAVKYTALSLEEIMNYRPDYTIDKIEELVEICREFQEKAV
jgi:pyrophosphatase PpaX